MINLKAIWPALASALITLTTHAQKLPSVQTASVLAPANIKIDGKATEWDNKFQAYNNHVEFYYTLSNDDNNLYLTVQAVDRAIVRRILNGGITLAVSKSGKKVDKNLPGITFPLFDKDNRFTPRFTGSAGSAPPPPMALMDALPAGGGGSPVNVRTIVVNGSPLNATPLTPAQTDSIMRVNNTNFAAKAKNIGVKGIKAIEDSLISVYNEDGIKAAGTFDNKSIFTCEMAIPLKYFGLEASKDKFLYHVTINQVEQKGVDIQTSSGPDGSQKIMSVHIGPGAQMGQPATDFWGEYTLAKK